MDYIVIFGKLGVKVKGGDPARYHHSGFKFTVDINDISRVDGLL